MNKVSAIVCVSPDWGIGDSKGDLIYRNKMDLGFFSGFTQGKVCFVGMNTYNTLPTLHNRSVVIDKRYTHESLTLLAEQEGKDVVLIGGAKTYSKYALQVSELYITKMKCQSVKAPRTFFDIEKYQHLDKEEVILDNKDFILYRKFVK